MDHQHNLQQAIRIVKRLLEAPADGKPLNIKVDHSILQLTELDAPIWPHQSVGQEDESTIEPSLQHPTTKRYLLAYYAAVSPYLLPFLKDRPLTMRLFPEGITSQSQIERYTSQPQPDYVESISMYSDLASQNMDFILCQNAATLLWLVNQSAVEFYPWYSRITSHNSQLPAIFINSAGTLDMSVANYPDYLVFDLDSVSPLAIGPGLTDQAKFDRNKEAALFLHQFLQKYRLDSHVKTSGKTGLHIYIPIQRHYKYDQVRNAAKTIGQELVNQNPQLFSMGWQLDQQVRVSIDFHQNSRNKGFAAPYSLRATDQATISLPLSWKELEQLESPQQLNLTRYFNSDLATYQAFSSQTFDWLNPVEQDLSRIIQD